MSDSLFERGKALEDRFFSERDKVLLEKLRQEIENNENVDALAAATGIKDQNVLKALVDQNIGAETLTSISLVPLVAVAWADRVLEPAERDAILKAADEAGIKSDSAAYQLLASWMNSKPADDLLECWTAYIAELKPTLDETAFNQLKTSVLGRAKEVAEAAGGFLGLGNTSLSENLVLSQLEESFK